MGKKEIYINFYFSDPEAEPTSDFFWRNGYVFDIFIFPIYRGSKTINICICKNINILLAYDGSKTLVDFQKSLWNYLKPSKLLRHRKTHSSLCPVLPESIFLY